MHVYEFPMSQTRKTKNSIEISLHSYFVKEVITHFFILHDYWTIEHFPITVFDSLLLTLAINSAPPTSADILIAFFCFYTVKTFDINSN